MFKLPIRCLLESAVGVEALRGHARIADRDLAFRRQLLQQPLADFLCRFQAGLLVAHVLHVRGRVEDQRRGHRRLLAAEALRELDARPGQRQGQHGDRRRAEQQKQQVPQPQPPLVLVVPPLDEPQRRELQQLRLLAHDQVQDDRNRDHARAAQQCEVEEGHAVTRSPASGPVHQILRQCPVELHARVQRHVVDPGLARTRV